MSIIEEILKLSHITKYYPGVTALDDVSVSFAAGEVHAVMGENGAGKSTLIKVISGAIRPDKGTVRMMGKEYAQMTPALSRELGIGVIYQEFNLIPSMSVSENIFLGDRIGGKVRADFKKMREKTLEVFASLGVTMDPDRIVGELSTAQQQIVEIAKAISKDARILIMDEPSAAIAVTEVERLFQIIRLLKEKGVTIVYISHRMEEIFEIADRITIMRDGRYISTDYLTDVSRGELIRRMVGRELSEKFPERQVQVGEPVLELEHVSGNGDRDINLVLRRGEILGLSGLVGAGRTELAKLIYGAVRPDEGVIKVNGEPVHFREPGHAIRKGIGLIPEDRKREGAFLDYTVKWNISVMSLKRLSKWTIVNKKEADSLSDDYISLLGIKTSSPEQLVRNLSGGNQQKVVLAKVLAAQTDILIFDEPTRGIDIGAKHEIYNLMNELAEQGKSIIIISSEMEELIGMSDRILVLHEGRITGEVTKAEFDQKRILELASGM